MDGLGHTAPARCVHTSKSETRCLLLESPTTHPAGKKLGVVGPIPKGKRFPYLLEKLQELGVHSYAPLQTDHSIREDWSQESRKSMGERLMEACKQSRCPYLLKLEDAASLRDLEPGPLALVLDVEAPPLLGVGVAGETTLLYGPEAGWSQGERDFFRERGWQRVGLNRQHLRMETAAILGSGTVIQMQERP